VLPAGNRATQPVNNRATDVANLQVLELLQRGRPVLLDGATGTELERRGIPLTPPVWSAAAIFEHPDVLRQIHRDYVAAGARIVTANTFRTHARNLSAWGQEKEFRLWTCRAVEIARQAAEDQALVAGSMAPLGDCYSPGQTPPREELCREHQAMAEALAAAQVDLILIETQLSIEEAAAAAQAARSTGLPFFVSFVCGRDGRLLSGEPLPQAFATLAGFEPAALMVNCLPADEVLSTLHPARASAAGIPLGAYANTGRLLQAGVWESTEGIDPAVYAGYAERWMDSGIVLIGGCCGTTPQHLSAISNSL
jgi:homocysteine S-methyltransferase